MNASEARKISEAYLINLKRNHDIEYANIRAKENLKIAKLKKSGRFSELVKEIENHVKRISAMGGRDLSQLEYMAFYLHGEDTILYGELVKLFQERGFKMKLFAGSGIQLQW